jgi:hypothetical protein
LRAGAAPHSPDPRDGRVHIYDIRREPFSNIEDWLYAIQRNYRRRHPPPTDHDIWN